MTVLADYAVHEECGNNQGNDLTRSSSGNARTQSSQLAEPLWTDPWPKRMALVRACRSSLKMIKARAGNDSSNFAHTPHMQGNHH